MTKTLVAMGLGKKESKGKYFLEAMEMKSCCLSLLLQVTVHTLRLEGPHKLTGLPY